MFPILILILVIYFLHVKFIKPYSTWTKRGIKQTNPVYIFGDNVGPIFGRQSFHDMFQNLYNSFPEERYFGMYQMTLPTLLIRDPDLVKTLTIKDFDHFINRRNSFPDEVEPLWTRNLVFMQGNQWKQSRITLSPTFTSSKIKSIFKVISGCCHIYVKNFQEKNIGQPLELRDVAARFTNDVIANVAFGIKSDSINNKDNMFFTMAGSISTNTTWRLLSSFLYTLLPTLCKWLDIKIFPRNITKLFSDVIKDTIKLRETQEVIRPDMIHMLLKTRKETNNELSDEDIAAHAFMFYIAGYETVSSTLYFMGHTLATHPWIQKKLQKEIDQTITDCGGTLTYEALQKMKYLDTIISETLRKWPSLPFLNRVCSKAYTLPPSNDKGRPTQIYPGEPLLIPLMALHYDPQYFPNPDVFDPERFNDDNKHKINPYAYMPFGLGPRKCIGSRLALLEVKLFYFYFLQNFDFLPNERTEMCLKLNKSVFTTSCENEVWVTIKPRIK